MTCWRRLLRVLRLCQNGTRESRASTYASHMPTLGGQGAGQPLSFGVRRPSHFLEARSCSKLPDRAVDHQSWRREQDESTVPHWSTYHLAGEIEHMTSIRSDRCRPMIRWRPSSLQQKASTPTVKDVRHPMTGSEVFLRDEILLPMNRTITGQAELAFAA